MANKPISPTSVDEVVKVSHKVRLPPFCHKVIHGHTRLILTGCQLNVMTHGLETRSPRLPLGVDVLSAHATLTTGSEQVTVIQNNTDNWLEVDKGIPIARMVSANQILSVEGDISAPKPQERQPTLTEAERQVLLLEKLDLTGLEAWDPEEAVQARSLLKEYNDLFSWEKHKIGCTKAVKHKIVLRDPEAPPFKERFRRISPPQV